MDYRDRIYGQYASGHTANLYGRVSLSDIESQFPVWRSYFGRWLPARAGARALDLGCGIGSFVYWLSKTGLAHVEGVDVSKEQIALGEEMGIKGLTEDSVENFLADKQGVYDLISGRDVLEHFRKEEILPLLDQVHDALAPGGVFVIQTLNAANLMWGRLRHGDFTHESAFTRESMRQVLLASGFRNIEIIPQRPVVHGLVSAIRALLWFGIEIGTRLYLFIETGSFSGIFTQNILVRAEK